MLGMHMGRVPAPSAREESGEIHRLDTYDWLQMINRASIVSNVEEGLLEKPLARRILTALNTLRDEAAKPNAVRPGLYITFEPEVLKLVGMEASVLHVGRSSQDILATANAGLNIARLMRLLDAIHEVDCALLEVARREDGALVPAYTNGVQAQPTLYSHYLLAQHQVFMRDAARIFECIRRYDVSPMGACVCNGTGWPLNVERMAQLQGFSRPLTNAFDVGQCAGNDLPLEMSQIISAVMLHVNAFLADFMVQYADPHPWIRWESANGLYCSSAMPQKRNPGLINDCRRDAGLVIGEAQGVMLRIQNLQLGMADVRDAQVLEALADDACITLRTFAGIVRELVVDRKRALAELNADWTCTQELADRLVRCRVDFRNAHHFASHLVTRARAAGTTPPELDYEEAKSLWLEWRSTLQNACDIPDSFPLSEKAFLGALDPAGIVAARATVGSANPELVAKGILRAQQEAARIKAEIDALVDHAKKTAFVLEEALARVLAD